MEIQIYNPTNNQPLPTVQWNYPELKAWLTDGLKRYEGIVYDESQIVQAKKDRANLNKLADAIDGKRKEMKAVYLHPYAEFEAQAKELTAMVKTQADAIAAQIKAYDDFRKQEKQTEIMGLYAKIFGDLSALIPYERIHNPKWLNVTTSLTAVAEEIAGYAERIEKGLAAIDKLGVTADIADRLKGVFLQKFDLAAALAEKERYEKQREELARYNAARTGREAVTAETPRQEPPRQEPEQPITPEAPAALPDPSESLRTVIFKVEATDVQLAALKAFLKTNNIKYSRP